MRYGNGRSYEKLGFKLKNISQGWQWTDYKVRYNRLFVTKDKEGFSKNLDKIYDAGQAKYVLEIKKENEVI